MERILTKRQEEILELVKKGMTISQIAKTLYISTRTVEVHYKNIKNKLGAINMAHAIWICTGGVKNV